MTGRSPRHVRDRLRDILAAVQRIKLAERELPTSSSDAAVLSALSL
ncbi:MAG: hypothetical protein ACR2JX_05715 [Mycobacteriales bacterium]